MAGLEATIKRNKLAADLNGAKDRITQVSSQAQSGAVGVVTVLTATLNAMVDDANYTQADKDDVLAVANSMKDVIQSLATSLSQQVDQLIAEYGSQE